MVLFCKGEEYEYLLFITAGPFGTLKLKRCFPFSVAQGKRIARPFSVEEKELQESCSGVTSHLEMFLITKRRH